MEKKKLVYVFVLLLTSASMTQAHAQKQVDSVYRDTTIEVTKVENYVKGGTAFQLQDYIKINVKNLNLFVKKAPKKSAPVLLYLDSNPIKNIKYITLDTCENFVTFQITRDSASTLDIFYKRPRRPWEKKVVASIGFENCCVVDSEKAITLIIIDQKWYGLGIAMLICFVSLIVVLAIKSDIIKDSSSVNEKKPYSLARTQLAFWITLIACSYAFIYISTNEALIISNSTLILLGISAGTAGISKLIDVDHEKRPGIEMVRNQPSQGFFIDILSDEKGVSIHRFQMLIFNMVIGFIFIHKVLESFEMPDIDTNLLILIGISDGTYAGIKIQENSVSKSAETPQK